jgi:iron complex outermembrane receptor protein
VKRHSSVYIAAALVISVAAAFAIPAHSQTQPSGVDSSDSGLQEIVVVAQRRSENLQAIPLTVNVVSGDSLANRGVVDIRDLGQVVAGLQIPVIGISSAPFLRGVGSQDVNVNAEPSVALYVDGVYIPAGNGAATLGLNNVDHVEVIKGPQGTLFGRNAVGGVIQVITRTPQQAPSLEISAGYGNYNTPTGSLYVTSGITSTLAFDFAAKVIDQEQGWGRDVTTGLETYMQKESDVAASLLFTPSDATAVRLQLDFGHTDGSLHDYQLTPGTIGANGVPALAQGYDTQGDHPNIEITQQEGASLHITQDLGFAQGVSITSIRRTNSKLHEDVDATAAPLFNADFYYSVQDETQEFQLQALPASRVHWIAGVYLYHNRAQYVNTDLYGDNFGGAVIQFNVGQITDAWAGYTQATTEVFANTDLTAGVRYSHDERRADPTEEQIIGTPIMLFPDRTESSSKVTYRLALDHAFTEDLHSYASFNTGFRSGGFQLFNIGTAPFLPETLTAYEVGLKSELFQRTLRLNFAAFYYDQKDIQVTVLPPSGPQYITNAAAATLKGLDFDFEARAMRNLTVTGGGEFLDGKYDNFPGAVSQPISGFPPTPPTTFNAKGNTTVNSPRFVGNLALNYSVETGVGAFTLVPSVSYSDTFFWSADNRNIESPYWLVNTKLMWSSSDGRYGASLWGRNLTKAYYHTEVTTSADGTLNVPGEPRTYGFTVNAKFH